MRDWCRAIEEKHGLHSPLAPGKILLVIFNRSLNCGEVGGKAGDGVLPQGCNVALRRHAVIALADSCNGCPWGGFEISRCLATLSAGAYGRKCHNRQGDAETEEPARHQIHEFRLYFHRFGEDLVSLRPVPCPLLRFCAAGNG